MQPQPFCGETVNGVNDGEGSNHFQTGANMLQMMDMHPPCFLTKTRCTYKLCGYMDLCVSNLGSLRMQRRCITPIGTVTHDNWVMLLMNLCIDRHLKK